MPDWTLVRGAHVLAAIEEYDRVGSKDFLARSGFRRARVYTLWHHGNEYDAPAILGVAYLRATGRPVTFEEFPDGEQSAATVLTDLGFDVVAIEQPVTSSRPRTTPTPKKRSTAPEPALRLCPRCHVAVPASGICDFCD
jgi:hypothetical protein